MNTSAVEQFSLYLSPQILVTWRALIPSVLKQKHSTVFNCTLPLLHLHEATLMTVPNRKIGTIYHYRIKYYSPLPQWVSGGC